ncbi:MAG: efflux RND transporter permease subunit [Bacteroidales bacterium]
MEKFVKKVIALRWPIIIMVLCTSLYLGYHLQFLSINSDILSSLPDDDKDAVLLKSIGERFGGNNMGIVILETDNIFQADVISHIKLITDSLATIEGITSVTSLTNIIDIKSNEYGLDIGKLVDEYDMPETPVQLDELRERVFAKEMYRGSIVSDDGTSALIIFTLDEDAIVKEVAARVKDKTASLNLPEKLYYIGSPMLVTYISDLMTRDLVRLLPIAFFLIALILMLSFRSVRGVLLPLLTAAIAIIWTLGIMALGGYEMSMISNNIPIIILAVGTAYTIHVINRVYQVFENDQVKAVKRSMVYLIIPIILAAITTIIGFVSFIFGAYLNMIRDFGIFTALGTLFSALLTIFFIPAVLSVMPVSRKNKSHLKEQKEKSYLSEKMLLPLNNLLFKHPKYILTSWGILITLSIAGIFFIERSVDIQEYFKKGNPTRQAESIMVEKFGGTKPIFVLFKGDVQSPEVLKMMEKTASFMKQSPDIYTTQSIADLIIELNGLIGGNYEIPDDRDMIEQLWFLLDGNETLDRFVSQDLDEGIIISKFKSPDNQAKKKFAGDMHQFIKENSSTECTIEITGMPFVDITMDRSLINSQLLSLSIAVFFVIIIVGLILRSLIRGVYATISIVASIIILFGVMGITGISLNIATVLVASVALGIGIDYSIHVISHFNHIFKQTGDVKKALEETITISGKAILINVLSVSGGFLVLIFSEMVPLQYFGFLIALSMIGSSQGALTLLPVILILVHRK